jgi:hypothetical protein
MRIARANAESLPRSSKQQSDERWQRLITGTVKFVTLSRDLPAQQRIFGQQLRAPLPLEPDSFKLHCLLLRHVAGDRHFQIEQLLTSSASGDLPGRQIVALTQVSGSGKTKVAVSMHQFGKRACIFVTCHSAGSFHPAVVRLDLNLLGPTEGAVGVQSLSMPALQQLDAVYHRWVKLFVLSFVRVAVRLVRDPQLSGLKTPDERADALLYASRHPLAAEAVADVFAQNALSAVEQQPFHELVADWTRDCEGAFPHGYFLCYDESYPLSDRCTGYFLHSELGVDPRELRIRERDNSSNNALESSSTNLLYAVRIVMSEQLKAGVPQLMVDTHFRIWQHTVTALVSTRHSPISPVVDLPAITEQDIVQFMHNFYAITGDECARAGMSKLVGRAHFFFDIFLQKWCELLRSSSGNTPSAAAASPSTHSVVNSLQAICTAAFADAEKSLLKVLDNHIDGKRGDKIVGKSGTPTRDVILKAFTEARLRGTLSPDLCGRLHHCSPSLMVVAAQVAWSIHLMTNCRSWSRGVWFVCRPLIQKAHKKRTLPQSRCYFRH